MPRRALLLYVLAALGSQLSAGCCCWRPFAHCWANAGCATCVGSSPAPGCSSCGASPLAGMPAGPILPPPPGGYAVAAGPVMTAPPAGSVFTGPPTAPFPGPTVTKEAFPTTPR